MDECKSESERKKKGKERKIKKKKRERKKKEKERIKGKGREGKIIIHVPLCGALFWPYIDGCRGINS